MKGVIDSWLRVLLTVELVMVSQLHDLVALPSEEL